MRTMWKMREQRTSMPLLSPGAAGIPVKQDAKRKVEDPVEDKEQLENKKPKVDTEQTNETNEEGEYEEEDDEEEEEEEIEEGYIEGQLPFSSSGPDTITQNVLKARSPSLSISVQIESSDHQSLTSPQKPTSTSSPGQKSSGPVLAQIASKSNTLRKVEPSFIPAPPPLMNKPSVMTPTKAQKPKDDYDDEGDSESPIEDFTQQRYSTRGSTTASPERKQPPPESKDSRSSTPRSKKNWLDSILN